MGHAFTIVAGLICILGARKWTNKLIALDNKYADQLEASAKTSAPVSPQS